MKMRREAARTCLQREKKKEYQKLQEYKKHIAKTRLKDEQGYK